MSIFRLLKAAALVVAIGGASPVLAEGGTLVEGTWLTPDQAQMTIATCEHGICGTLSKIVITEAHVQQYGVDASAIDIGAITDVLNKDPALRGRPMLGLQILTLKATTNPWHYEGEIYNPQDGNTYAGFIDVKDADSIVLKGCALYVLCQEQVWTRVAVEDEAAVAQ